ncbi:hypothetical protein WJX84_004485 [Apatococcus fuscideae]|uniref:Uncharacterized protein n=1 Tax=Apatococcus fuscideae TaxID=2026836 RepID=A0AAW1T243_9CHLO
MGSLQMVPMTSIIQFLLVPRQISGVFCPVWLDNNTVCAFCGEFRSLKLGWAPPCQLASYASSGEPPC